jgi:phospholipase C
MPLTPPARSLLALLLSKYGEPGEKTPQNYGEAFELLQRLAKKPSDQ